MSVHLLQIPEVWPETQVGSVPQKWAGTDISSSSYVVILNKHAFTKYTQEDLNYFKQYQIAIMEKNASNFAV